MPAIRSFLLEIITTKSLSQDIIISRRNKLFIYARQITIKKLCNKALALCQDLCIKHSFFMALINVTAVGQN